MSGRGVIKLRPSRTRCVEAWIFFLVAAGVALTFLLVPFGLRFFPGSQLWRSFHLAGLYIPLALFLLGWYLERGSSSAALPVRLFLGVFPFLFSSVTLKLLFGQSSPLLDWIRAQLSPLVAAPIFACLAVVSAMIMFNDRMVDGLVALFARAFVGLWDDGTGPKLDPQEVLPPVGASAAAGAAAGATVSWEQTPPWLASSSPRSGKLPGGPVAGQEKENAPPVAPASPSPAPPLAPLAGPAAGELLAAGSAAEMAWIDPDPGLALVEDEQEEGPGDWRPWQGEVDAAAVQPSSPPASAEVPLAPQLSPSAPQSLNSPAPPQQATPAAALPQQAAPPLALQLELQLQPPSAAAPSGVAGEGEALAPRGYRHDRAMEKLLTPLQVAAVSYPKAKRRWVQYRVPIERLLAESGPEAEQQLSQETMRTTSQVLLQTLREFRIEAKITGVSCGPAITQYEILPAAGVKLSRIEGLADNIALRLAAASVRIVAPIPGKQAVGVELPNPQRQVVSFRALMQDERAQESLANMVLPVFLGRGIDGTVRMLDLSEAPHLLVAGATGSGKSVCINALITSLISCRAPTQLRLLLVDPKIVELKLYNDIPHLLTPVITEPKKAVQALRWCLCEMERRYWLLDQVGVRDIGSYNQKLKAKGLQFPSMEYLVVIVDEFADLMALTGKELEAMIARMAAMSRAVGIHLVLATQRPSVDVITGLIKANFPTRIAFMVASKVDSRIILDAQGAEQLLGKGDMLFASAARLHADRIQGVYLAEDEIEQITDYVRSQGEPHYMDEEIFLAEDVGESGADAGEDALYQRALELARVQQQVSASLLQRKLQIGYNRAARIVERMAAEGRIGPQNGAKPRELLQREASQREPVQR